MRYSNFASNERRGPPNHAIKYAPFGRRTFASLGRLLRALAVIVKSQTMEILEATIDDAGQILQLQKRAYYSEAVLNGDHTIPPLTQTLEELRAEFSTKFIIKVIDEGGIVGSGQARLESGTCHIGRMAVEPSQRCRGIGSQILRTLERKFSDAARYELFTGEKSLPNISMYERRGYRIFKKSLCGKTVVVFMEKCNLGG